MRKLGSCLSTMVGCIFFALLLTLLIGPAVALELSGATMPGVVVDKHERISVRAGLWHRQLLIEARTSMPDDETFTAEQGTLIAVEPELYDQLRVGDAAELRYLELPILNGLDSNGIARLTAQRPLGTLVAAARPLLFFGLIVGVWLVLLAIWSRKRSGWLAGLLFVGMVGGGLYIGSGWPPPLPGGPRATALATVRDLHRVDRVWGGRRTAAEDAVQPYDIVELEFQPSGAAGPVIAVDLVDAGSVPALAKGARLPIHYSLQDHRWAQLDSAQRTYYWKNMRSFAIIIVVLAVVVVGGWVVGRWRRRTRVGTPGIPRPPSLGP